MKFLIECQRDAAILLRAEIEAPDAESALAQAESLPASAWEDCGVVAHYDSGEMHARTRAGGPSLASVEYG